MLIDRLGVRRAAILAVVGAAMMTAMPQVLRAANATQVVDEGVPPKANEEWWLEKVWRHLQNAGGSCTRRLVSAYPASLASAPGGIRVLRTGVEIPCGQVSSNPDFEWRLANATLADQLSQIYPAGRNFKIPLGDNDPGRLRHVPLFMAMYGSTEAQVRANLTPVRWVDGTMVLMSRINGAAGALANVVADLQKLPPAYRKYLDQPAGTFNWRQVAGTDYLSAHSFGVAIDINIREADYWRWNAKRAGSAGYRNRIPLEIVDIFERHGFIWGGKWAHYDTMHFEYRPELLPRL
jgi:hypothetical protein